MFIQKPRRTSSNGIIVTPYSYSNTNQTDNTPVTEVTGDGDLNHLSPTLTQPPIAPDTITPVVTPDTDRINLLLPVGGFVGTVYVVLTKPTPNAAVVVVEVTNDDMTYDEKKDVTPIGQVASSVLDPAEGYVFSEARLQENIQFAKESIRGAFEDNISPYTPPILGSSVHTFVDLIVDKLAPELIKCSYAKDGATVGGGRLSNSFSNVNFSTLRRSDRPTSGLITIPKITLNPPVDEPVQINLGEIMHVQNEIYKTGGNTAQTVELPVKMYFEYLLLPLVGDETTYSIVSYVAQVNVTVNYIPPEHCLPVAESVDVDAGTAKIIDEYYFGSGKTKIKIRRGYTNIGGKLKYLYTVKKDTPTEVFVNYDGSNYGITVTTPDHAKVITRASTPPTASFTNNVNGVTLTAPQQTALEQCLPQPDDTLQGGFKAMSGATEISFKSYGFKSIFYQTPTKYNNTTLKACAVYVL